MRVNVYHYCRVTETKNIAVYGTLMDQFPDNIWNSMPNVGSVRFLKLNFVFNVNSSMV